MVYDVQVINRMKRIEGQLRGILKMMEGEKECKDIITQLSAARTAIDRTIGVIVSSNLVDCIKNSGDLSVNIQDELIKKAVNLLVKSR